MQVSYKPLLVKNTKSQKDMLGEDKNVKTASELNLTVSEERK